MRSSFDKKRALNALLYVIQNCTVRDKIHIIKVIYFAEKHHLENYGRLICHDDYKRMQFGPVPTRIYDILKAVQGKAQSNFLESNPEFVADASSKIQANVDEFTILQPPNLDYLSESDIKSLDWAIREYGSLPFDDLVDKSHDEVWKAADRFDISLEEIIATLPNHEDLREYSNADC